MPLTFTDSRDAAMQARPCFNSSKLVKERYNLMEVLGWMDVFNFHMMALIRLLIVGCDADAGLERHQIKDLFWRLCSWEEGPDDVVLSPLVVSRF